MVYSGSLPQMTTLRRLADVIGLFPVRNHQLVLTSQQLGSSEGVADFLRLFPAFEQFHTRDEFLERCEKLELVIREEQQAPRENLREP